jgi:hypothetical protein
MARPQQAPGWHLDAACVELRFRVEGFDNFATLYEDEFAVEGFNQASFAGYYDVV